MKISEDCLNELIQLAWKVHREVNQDPRAKYRFGQSLWNVLPDVVTGGIAQTDKDFFYWSDGRVAEILEIAYSEFVG